jgi:hypothetical protein
MFQVWQVQKLQIIAPGELVLSRCAGFTSLIYLCCYSCVLVGTDSCVGFIVRTNCAITMLLCAFTQLCGMCPASGADPEEVVALGAALQVGGDQPG